MATATAKRKSLWLALAAALALVACTDELREAEDFKSQGRYRSALESYLFYTKTHPGDAKVPHALLEAGKIYTFNLHEPRKAVVLLKQLVANFPKSESTLEAQHLIADIVKNNLGDFRQALVEYQRLIDIAPDSPKNDEYQLQIANCYTMLGEHGQARVEYQALLRNHSQSPLIPQAVYQIANSFYIAGKYKEAVEHYQRVIQEFKDPDLVSKAKFGLASCYEEMDELPKAIELYRAIEKEYPTPEVIRIRIQRIEKRMIKRGRGDEEKIKKAV